MKIKIQYIFSIIILFTTYSSYSNEKNGITIDTVISFKAGEGQNSGQSAEYFPTNIYGIPSRYPNDKIPESSPTEVLSLGLGGEIIVSFKNCSIIDGDGVDFVIFENVFTNPINKKLFVEPAIVSVSQDGFNFIEFPYDYNTLKGCAGLTPTFGENNPFDFPSSGGDGFDLAEIGLTEIKYIKIKDITDKLLQDSEHFYYDPIISGFDLDAVLGLNYKVNSIENSIQSENLKQNKTPIQSINLTENSLLINFKNNEFNTNNKSNSEYQLKVFDILGNEIYSSKLDTAISQDYVIEFQFPKIILLQLLKLSNDDGWIKENKNYQLINLKLIRE